MAGPGARGGALRSPEVGGSGVGGCWRLPWAGRRGSGLRPPPPHCTLRPSFPRAGHFLPQAAVGTFVPLLKSLCHLLPPLLGRRRGADPPPRWERGGDCRADRLLGPQGAAWAASLRNRDAGRSVMGEPLSESTAPRHSSPLPPSLALIWAPASSLAVTPLTTHLPALPFLPDTVAPPLRRHCPGPPQPPGGGLDRAAGGREPLPSPGGGGDRSA